MQLRDLDDLNYHINQGGPRKLGFIIQTGFQWSMVYCNQSVGN